MKFEVEALIFKLKVLKFVWKYTHSIKFLKTNFKHHLQTAEVQCKFEFFCFKFHTKSENDEILNKMSKRGNRSLTTNTLPLVSIEPFSLHSIRRLYNTRGAFCSSQFSLAGSEGSAISSLAGSLTAEHRAKFF